MVVQKKARNESEGIVFCGTFKKNCITTKFTLMRNCTFIIIPLSFLVVACISNSSNVRMNEKYQAYKNEFDTLLTSHFPKTILSYPNQIINSKHVSKNDVGFLLYEYGLDTLKVDSLDDYYEKRAIAIYNASDTCLLIVNRFETIETF